MYHQKHYTVKFLGEVLEEAAGLCDASWESKQLWLGSRKAG